MDLDYNQILSSLSAIVPPGAVFELRLLGAKKWNIDSGYFNDPAIAANALVGSKGYYKGVYMTLNPVHPDAMARASNRLAPQAQTTTNDKEIVRRKWLGIDIDARRMADISSSAAEHAEALKAAHSISGTLSLLYGFPQPMITDSGNGAWIMYRIDEENSDTVRDEIHSFLRIIKAQYDSAAVDIDTTVFNAARITRVPGTWARKGDSTDERPHRRGSVVQLADPFRQLSLVSVMRYNSTHQALLKGDKVGAAKKTVNEYPQDETVYKRLNEYAMRNVKSWVLEFFPTAREYKEGYRIASDDINQPYEEELTIHPWPMGIKYFGVADQDDTTEGRRTPVSVIAEYALNTSDKALAAQKLSAVLNFPINELGAIQPQLAPAGLSGGGGGALAGLMGTSGKISFKGVRSIAELNKKQFKQVEWIVQDVIPAGNILLAARPKMRKTWLALQLALAVARGEQFLGYQCIKGDVLFLGLEDNERRVQNRIQTLDKFRLGSGDLSGFRYWTGGMDYNGAGQLTLANPEEQAELLNVFPRGEAGVDALDQYLDEYPLTRLIIIDTLQHFRGERTSRDIYASDYESMMPITKLAARRGVCLMPVTHEKKGNADRGIGGDFLEDVTGSAGISGGVDGVVSIKGRRGVQEENESRKLLVSGRDIPFDYELDISFDAERGGWHKAAREDVKVAIRGLLTQHTFLNQKDFQHLLPNAGQARIYQALTQMKLEGEVEQGKYGYTLKR